MQPLTDLGRRAIVLLAVGLAGCEVTFGLRPAGASDVAVFLAAAVTLAGLVGEAADQLGSRLGRPPQASSSRRRAPALRLGVVHSTGHGPPDRRHRRITCRA